MTGFPNLMLSYIKLYSAFYSLIMGSFANLLWPLIKRVESCCAFYIQYYIFFFTEQGIRIWSFNAILEIIVMC